jgi:hypothetical protein
MCDVSSKYGRKSSRISQDARKEATMTLKNQKMKMDTILVMTIDDRQIQDPM